MDVVDYTIVRWFLGLTCDFWAENGKRKLRLEIRARESVVLLPTFGVVPSEALGVPGEYGSRFARMPTSQNRDMGHPILWLGLRCVSRLNLYVGF